MIAHLSTIIEEEQYQYQYKMDRNMLWWEIYINKYTCNNIVVCVDGLYLT
jgi:hypothetical protein